MSTNYPTSLDSYTNPLGTDKLILPPHSDQHGNVNDAVEAIETRLGTGTDTAPGAASKVFRSTSATASEWGKVVLGTDTSGSLSLIAQTGLLPLATGTSGSLSIASGGTGLSVDRVLGYAEVTANQNGITTITDLTSLTLNVTVPSASRYIRITGYAGTTPDTNGAQIILFIREGSTQLHAQSYHATVGVGSPSQSLNALYVAQVTAGAHTYKLSLAASAGTVNMEAAATYPAFILVEVL